VFLHRGGGARRLLRNQVLPTRRRVRSRAAQELVRILSPRHGHDATSHRVLGREHGGFARRISPGSVGIEHQEKLIGEPLEKAYLLLGQGGAGAGDRVRHRELVGGDDVELALHHHGVAAPGDLIPGQVQAEHHSSFYVGGGFGRVDVLFRLGGTDGGGGQGQGRAA